jgi:hypothetical protein
MNLFEDTYDQARLGHDFAKQMLVNAKKKKLPSEKYWQARMDDAKKRMTLMRKTKKDAPKDTKDTTGHYGHETKSGVAGHAQVFKKELANHTTTAALIDHGKHLSHDLKKAFAVVKGSDARRTRLFQHISRNVAGLGKITNNFAGQIKDLSARLQTEFTPEERAAMQKDPDSFKDKLLAKVTPREQQSLKLAGKIGYTAAGAYLLGTYGSYIGGSLGTAFKSAANMQDATNIMDMALKHMPEFLQHHVAHATKEAVMMTVLHAAGKSAGVVEAVKPAGSDNLMMDIIPLYMKVLDTPEGRNAILQATREYSQKFTSDKESSV